MNGYTLTAVIVVCVTAILITLLIIAAQHTRKER